MPGYHISLETTINKTKNGLSVFDVTLEIDLHLLHGLSAFDVTPQNCIVRFCGSSGLILGEGPGAQEPPDKQTSIMVKGTTMHVLWIDIYHALEDSIAPWVGLGYEAKFLNPTLDANVSPCTQFVYHGQVQGFLLTQVLQA